MAQFQQTLQKTRSEAASRFARSNYSLFDEARAIMNRRARSVRIHLAYPTEQMTRSRAIRTRNLIPALERDIARTHCTSNLLAHLLNVHERSVDHERGYPAATKSGTA